jgi:acetamidase/formamidase
VRPRRPGGFDDNSGHGDSPARCHPGNDVNVFSPGHLPRLTIDPGDTIVVRSLDAAGYLARHAFPGDTEQPTMFPGEFRGHCLTGPIAVRGAEPGGMLAVRGAEPGGMLAVRLISLRPDEWGWTVAPTVPDSPVSRRLGLTDSQPAWLLWDIDPDAGKATANGKYTRPLAPFRTGRAEALALASNCVDLRVTQVANVTWGVHALLPAGLLT